MRCPDIDETIRRLRAYAEAGADCLYPPRIDKLEHVSAIVAAVSLKPVNLLINALFTTIAERSWAFVGSALAAHSHVPQGVDSWRPPRESRMGDVLAFEGLPNVDALLGG